MTEHERRRVLQDAGFALLYLASAYGRGESLDMGELAGVVDRLRTVMQEQPAEPSGVPQLERV